MIVLAFLMILFSIADLQNITGVDILLSALLTVLAVLIVDWLKGRIIGNST